jgi:hypothetical protein
MNWETLIPLFERHQADTNFIAECVYAYIVNYGMDHPQDNDLLNEIIQFLKEEE